MQRGEVSARVERDFASDEFGRESALDPAVETTPQVAEEGHD